MKMKKAEKVKHADTDDVAAAPETTQEAVKTNVTCSYGIHRGNFPVAGMKVKDARAILKKLIKVDDTAIAVINGEEVGPDEVISAETTLLSFVKPSAKKGADTITIDGTSVSMEGSKKKMGVDQFCNLVAQSTISGLHSEPIPDHVKWIARSGPLSVYIAEFKPELRRIKWIDDNSPVPYGDGATYKYRKLATPYVVMKVPFCGNQLQGTVEVFYRNLPLVSLDDSLSYCNLLNVSPGAYGCTAWFCTQYLDVSGMSGPADILTGILSHVWGGGFNKSSEAHEGQSCFSLCQSKKLDSRVTDVNTWEKESEKNPRFVLDVKWHNTAVTPRSLIESEFKRVNITTCPNNSKALGNIMLGSRLLA